MPLAEFKTAPAGTERRNSIWNAWTPAAPGNILDVDGCESRNIDGTDYQMQLYADVGLFFGSSVIVTLSDIQGVVKYRDATDTWNLVSIPGSYNANAVSTWSGGGVSVVCGFQGVYKPRPGK